jgi:hypothetical protein
VLGIVRAVRKRKRPGRRCWLSPARLPGLLGWTGPPLVDCRALTFVSTCSHRPSRLAARRAMPRFGLDTGFPASNPWHRFTLTRLPEPSVLAPGTELAESSWGGPSSFGSSTTTPLLAPRPHVHRSALEGDERARLPRRPPRFLVTFADSSLPSSPRRGPTARIPLSPRERRGLGRSPPPRRPGWSALSGTISSKYVAKPQVKRYFGIHRVIP